MWGAAVSASVRSTRAPTDRYADQLRDPRWQRKRLEVLQRHGFKCSECGSVDKTLNVHHAFYERGKKPWEYESRFLRSLCERCHQATEDVLADIRRLVGSYSLGELRVLRDRLDDRILEDVLEIIDRQIVCAICGAHRGMKPGRFLCESCRYDPFTDNEIA